MAMAGYRHYRNSDQCGQTMFITTTVLDFVHAFHREDVRDAMVFGIAQECRLARAALYAYVVMPHHVHLLVRMHETMNVRQFMNVFKRESSRAIVRLLSEGELEQFEQQRGLNGNTFWQRSFRSIVVEGEQMFWQKTGYIHANPVEAEYAERPEDYRWSSAGLIVRGLLSFESGLPYDAVVESLRPISGGACE
jgi:putative transposase